MNGANEQDETLPAPAEDFGWTLGVLLRAYRETVTPELGDVPHGSRGYQLLCEVVRGEQPSQLTLANRLGIDRTVMTYLIDDLVEAGLVERRANPSDRRQRLIAVTAKGRRALAKAGGRVADAEDRLLGGLEPDEREVLRRLLSRAACSNSEFGRGDTFDPAQEGGPGA